MVSYDWASDGSVGVFFRLGMVSGLCKELVLFQRMGMKLNDKLMLQGCREGYCECGPATGILCWVYDVLGESYMSCLSDLMGSKVDACFGNP